MATKIKIIDNKVMKHGFGKLGVGKAHKHGKKSIMPSHISKLYNR